ncbi:cobalt ABC transporter permease [Nocardioides sp. IC4_145]|uniref:PDGLE domain-containing protein n=1 Tax=Nocardioides sp. IC4_145 TaxID=2714037 RepID=UPI00140C1C1D|nr:PDGLE domain-containing protein [Nocardioides sp. IC4_145]NHC24026.1 cobalt ABC transporter permease [Nocardioides sp. IC4_145]
MSTDASSGNTTDDQTQQPVRRRVSTRALLVTGLVVALLVAGIASYYASSHPDGLEHVAGETGFLDTAEDSPTADSPFADYATKGVDDERLSVGIAGVLGTLVVLVLAGGLALALRRRGPTEQDTPDERASAAERA